MVVFDTAFLMYLLRPEVGPPLDGSGEAVFKWKERLALLVSTLDKARTKIIIPSPAMSELLVRAGMEQSQALVEEINKSSRFAVEAFDGTAAIEVAAMTREALATGDKRGGADGVWQKIKYDRQIVAIAKVRHAAAIYSNDTGIKILGERIGMQVVGIADLPLPPEKLQIDMFEDMPPDDADIAAAEIEAQNASDLPSV